MTGRALTFRSQRGATVVECMVATTVLAVLMAAACSSLILQLRTHGAQRLVIERLNDTRMALGVMAEQVKMAGFGVPSATAPGAAAKLISATTTRLSFWTKVSAGHTYLTAAATQNASSISVLSVACLPPGTSFYITDTKQWYFGTTQQTVGSSVSITPPLTYTFAAGSPVTPVEQVTFELVGEELRRNGHRLINNVTGLTFTYDATALSAIRQVTIALAARTRASDPADVEPGILVVTTRVAPPNLGL